MENKSELEIAVELIKKSKIGDTVGFKIGEKHFVIKRDE